jgi:hypothetical protein
MQNQVRSLTRNMRLKANGSVRSFPVLGDLMP